MFTERSLPGVFQRQRELSKDTFRSICGTRKLCSFLEAVFVQQPQNQKQGGVVWAQLDPPGACVCVCVCVCVSAQLCPTLCNPLDCSPPGSSVRGILQTRILQWVAISYSRGSSRPRD